MTSSIEPTALLRSDRSTFITVAFTFTFAVAVALVSGLGGGLGHGGGLGGGLGLGIEVGLGLGLLKSTWPYFVMARVYLVVRRKAPRALMSFLQDAHEHRGVLRQVGPVYQFRHIDLQRHLAAQHNENRPRTRTGL
ncbi:hypothetical protein AB0I10_32285 [Streptomyces sp. NPDC050636]|uniref:hypothetical protein n=1 Tax=Streptomyces sp. NPDC050636 TaxID=3154510 RepID=UPI003443A553